MCDCSPHVLLLHLLGLALGLMVIAELQRQNVERRLFWSAVGVMSLAMAAFLFHASEPYEQFDDFNVYLAAGRAALHEPSAIVALYGDGVTGFVNLPILAYAFAPFALFSPFLATLVFTICGCALVLVSWWLLVQAAELDDGGKAQLLFLFAAFGPLLYSIREGNTSHVVLALVVWAFLLLRVRRDFVAGLALGFAALIKPPLLLFGVYLALRGRWRGAMGGACVVGVVVLASLALFGWEAHLRWYETSIAPFARDPMPAMNVQSIAGALARLQLGPAHVLDWQTHELSPVLGWIAKGLTVGLFALAVASATAPGSTSPRSVSRDVAFEGEFLIVLMLACTVSTLSWSHYYTWMLMPVAFFVGRSQHFSTTPMARAIGWLAIVAAAGPIIRLHFDQPLLEELNGRLGASRLLLGGLCLLGLLMWSRWQMQPSLEVPADAASDGKGKRPSAVV